MEYLDDDFQVQEGRTLERNGQLRYIEREDGKREWVPDFMMLTHETALRYRG